MSVQLLQTDLSRLIVVYRALPEFSDRLSEGEIRERVGERCLALVATEDGRDLGFKLGYALDETTFYSWIGGVMPDCRGRGVAQGLLEMQETWARQQGFSLLRVKSMNRYPAMLRLLVRNGYHIDAVTEHENPLLSKIHFHKVLDLAGGPAGSTI